MKSNSIGAEIADLFTADFRSDRAFMTADVDPRMKCRKSWTDTNEQRYSRAAARNQANRDQLLEEIRSA